MSHFQNYSNCCQVAAQWIENSWFCPVCSKCCDTKLYFVQPGAEYEFWEAQRLSLLDYEGAVFEEIEEMEEQ